MRAIAMAVAISVVLAMSAGAPTCAATATPPVLEPQADGGSAEAGGRFVENIIWFQGFLADVDTGEPINDTYDFTVRIWDDESGGSLVWGAEQHQSTDVVEGWFHLPLGSVVGLPDFDAPPYYLEIEVEGEVMDARQRLGSVPMASLAGELDLPFRGSGITSGSFDGVLEIEQLSTGPAVMGESHGLGPAIFGFSDGPGAAVRGHHTGLGPAISGYAGGAGPAGSFIGDVQIDGTLQTEAFTFPTGATDGYVLTSDASGVASWQAAPGSGDDGDWKISGLNMYSLAPGNVGVGTSAPQTPLQVVPEGSMYSWGAGNGLGVFYVGDGSYGLSVGVATGGGGSGDCRIWPTGGTERLMFGNPTYNGDILTVDKTGNVGVRTTSPQTALDVEGTVNVAATGDLPALVAGSSTGNPSSVIILGEGTPSSSNLGSGEDVVAIAAGEGADDAADLIRAGKWIGALNFDNEFRVGVDGNVTCDGSFSGGGADFAEMLPITGGAAGSEPGDVMVIDPSGRGHLVRSDAARSTLVAGVYSTAPGFVATTRDWDHPTAGPDGRTRRYTLDELADEFGEIPLAVVGVVPCKASAENGPIAVGDLLVTSSTPGHCMRDGSPAIGSILGKALEPLDSGTGVIRVLVTLQ